MPTSNVTFLGVFAWENSQTLQKDIWKKIYCRCFCNSQKGKQYNCPLVEELINKLWFISTVEHCTKKMKWTRTIGTQHG